MDQAIKASIAAMMLLLTVPVIGDPMTGQDVEACAKQGQSLFDEARGVILEGDRSEERRVGKECA